MQDVLLVWTDGKWRVPIGIRIWQKGGRSKLKFPEKMLRKARRRGLTPMYVLFDSWHSGESLLNLLDSFAGATLRKPRKIDCSTKCAWIKPFIIAVVAKEEFKTNSALGADFKEDKKYYLTYDLSVTSAQVKRIYRSRQQIEEVFRVLKQEFGSGRCRAATVQSQKAHSHL